MAKADLEEIKERLDTAKYHIERANNAAKRVGDKSGSAKLDKLTKEVETTRSDFDERSK